MERKLLDLCREAPFEYEEGELLRDKASLYALCLEDLFLTSVPCTMFVFLGLVRVSTLATYFYKYPVRVSSQRQVLSYVLTTALALFPLAQLGSQWLKSPVSSVSIYYAASESLAWALSLVVFYMESSRNMQVSWTLNVFWFSAVLAGVAKSITRVYSASTDGSFGSSLVLHCIQACAVTCVFLLTFPPLHQKYDANKKQFKPAVRYKNSKFLMT
jgi:hypothetical protein